LASAGIHPRKWRNSCGVDALLCRISSKESSTIIFKKRDTMKEYKGQIDNWSIAYSRITPYEAPELRMACVQGKLNERGILTSYIVGKTKDGNILTRNSEYSLGEVDPLYEKEFPDAYSRLMNSLQEAVV